jgi:hypothetical protein
LSAVSPSVSFPTAVVQLLPPLSPPATCGCPTIDNDAVPNVDAVFGVPSSGVAL